VTRAKHCAAAAAYLAIALWVLGSTLSSFADAFPLWSGMKATGVTDGDQSHMIWAASRNARTFVTAPWRLWDFELCHPFPEAVALGHHLYANGLVGIVPYALTGEPILTLNVAVIAMLWVSGIGMYALAYYWTRSTAAAFVAGLLFAFMPQHLLTARWPSIIGNQWTPLALLFARTDGAYEANVQVSIQDDKGAAALVWNASGPVCLVDLPPGRYVVNAQLGGASKQQAVTVGGGSRSLDFRF